VPVSPSFLIFKTGNFWLFPAQNADTPNFTGKAIPAGQAMFSILLTDKYQHMKRALQVFVTKMNHYKRFFPMYIGKYL